MSDYSTRIYIKGETYPVKEQLKAIGCRWDKDRRAWYAESQDVATRARDIVSPPPLYNSPPPADLGTAGPADLAARFGRCAADGAKVVSFVVYGLAKGDEGRPDGSIRLVRGKRYVQVARTERRYLSREMLEDCDLFGEKPGGSYQWDGVEVMPTAEEAAADRAAADAAAAKEREAAEALARAEAEKADRAARWEAARCGLEATEADPGQVEYTGEEIVFGKAATARQVRLETGEIGWEHTISTYDNYARYWYLPPATARQARLDAAAEAGYTPERSAEWLSQHEGCRGTDVHQAVVEADAETQDRLRAAAAEKAAADLARAKQQEVDQLRRSAAVRCKGGA